MEEMQRTILGLQGDTVGDVLGLAASYSDFLTVTRSDSDYCSNFYCG